MDYQTDLFQSNENELIARGFVLNDDDGIWRKDGIKATQVERFIAFGIDEANGFETYGTVDIENVVLRGPMEKYMGTRCGNDGFLSFDKALEFTQAQYDKQRSVLVNYSLGLVEAARARGLPLGINQVGPMANAMMFGGTIKGRDKSAIELFRIEARHDGGIGFEVNGDYTIVDGQNVEDNLRLFLDGMEDVTPTPAHDRISYGTTQIFGSIIDAIPYLFKYRPVSAYKSVDDVVTKLSGQPHGVCSKFFKSEVVRTVTAYEFEFEKSVPSRD